MNTKDAGNHTKPDFPPQSFVHNFPHNNAAEIHEPKEKNA